MKQNRTILRSNAAKRRAGRLPDYVGTGIVNGKSMRIAAWLTQRRGGHEVYLAFSDPSEAPEQSREQSETAPRKEKSRQAAQDEAPSLFDRPDESTYLPDYIVALKRSHSHSGPNENPSESAISAEPIFDPETLPF